MTSNWAKNILFLLVYMISGLIFVIIAEGVLTGNDLAPINDAIEQVVIHVRTPVFTTFMVWVTKLGQPFVLSSLAVFIAVILFLKGYRYDAVLMVLTLAMAVVALVFLKNIFQINRPPTEIGGLSEWSFPSGHATIATTFFFALAYTLFNKLRSIVSRTYLITGAVIAASLISFSRLYLGAHWTLDILGGIALGFVSMSFTVLMASLFLSDKQSLRRLFR